MQVILSRRSFHGVKFPVYFICHYDIHKIFKNYISLSGPNRTSEHSSYLFSLDGGFFECHWKTACPREESIAIWIAIEEGCTGVETVIYRHSYISQVVYEQNLYFGLGPILRPITKLADLS